jgi:hypothetical protein
LFANHYQSQYRKASKEKITMATRGLPTWPLAGSEADTLPEGERLLLDAARAWAAGGPAGPIGEAALVLAAEGLEALALPLDAALRELPGLKLQWPLCPEVSHEEAALLLALAAAQNGRRVVALALLHRMAPSIRAYRASAEICVMAGVLRRSGVNLNAPM